MNKEAQAFLGPLEGTAKFFRRMFEAGVSLGALMRVVNHDDQLARAAAYIKAGCPEIAYSDGKATAVAKPQESVELAEFFQTRSGLWVDSDLKRYVGFGQSNSEQLAELVYSDLEKNTSEADLFGLPGTPEREETVRTAITLSQIQEKISAQWGGTEGELLNNGYANIFAVIGKNGELHVVNVYWHADYRYWIVICNPWRQGLVWHRGSRVFRNS